ncbi:hypothetical protein VE04_06660 [Pseudogymnoascus sp. 24MN13]|nr:hypothetical protein VE04_06660 [Pseudogymnoascus sp. 24MN13]
MAPALLETLPTAPYQSKKAVDTTIFHDGIKTSGQHPPLYDQLRPYSEFPKVCSGPSLWKPEDYKDNPEKWVHRFTAEEIDELGSVADKFIADGIPLTGISKSNFVLPKLGKLLSDVKHDLIEGKGFILFKGIPVQVWDNHKCAAAYMGLGTYLGYFISQNSRGHVLGHVKDVGDDATQTDKVRIYRTNARQFFHVDDCDIVGLLCIARAREGGESDLASTQHVWNTLQRERPDVAEALTKPIWYYDRKGETSFGEDEYVRQPLFYLETGSDNPRVFAKADPYFVKSLKRFSDIGEIPPLSTEHLEVLQVLEDTCMRLSLHMVLELGDIQFLHSGPHVFHSRTAYKDNLPPLPRRHLMRLWLAVPESEGGWKLPFHDSNEKKRGGIQVNDTPPVCPLDAE